MTKLFGPFNNGAGASIFESQWSKMMRTVFKDGVVNNSFNELSVYGDSTGMQVKVKSGAGWVRGHYYENDSEEVLAIAAANATNPRWDRIVLEVDWTKTDYQMSIAVVIGTPASSPTLPALTQSTSKWQIALATVVVGAGVSTITAGNVVDTRPLLSYLFINGQVHKQLWVAGWKPTVTNGCGLSSQIEMVTNKSVYDYVSFLKAADSYAYVNIDLPADYSGGVIYASPRWFHPATTTNYKTSLGLAGVSIGDNESMDAAVGTYQYSNGIGGTTNNRYKGPQTSAITIAGTPAANETLHLRCVRRTTDGTNDTLAVAVYLLGWMIWYPVQ
jgi:hypothetical protein